MGGFTVSLFYLNEQEKRKGKLEWDGDGTVTIHAYNLKESEMFHIVVVT